MESDSNWKISIINGMYNWNCDLCEKNGRLYFCWSIDLEDLKTTIRRHMRDFHKPSKPKRKDFQKIIPK